MLVLNQRISVHLSATAEDFFEGYSIADEYSPDQVGAVLRPIYTVPGDFIQSLASAYMMILSGIGPISVAQDSAKLLTC
jgi:acetyl-CoA C-acetyltransferase